MLEFRDTADDEEKRMTDASLESLEGEGRSKEDVIELVDREQLQELINNNGFITVLFYPKSGCTNCEDILTELEEIDDETDKYGIHFVKTEDTKYAEELAGITEFPALVYFEDGAPSIYDGDLLIEEEVLAWLVRQKTEDTIENVNRDLLFRIIGEKEYVAVLFYKKNDDESEEIIEHLENIDDDCGDYEVHLVKICDHLIAKKYGVKEPPGLVFFRRGKPVKYEGDLFDEFEVLEWLTRPENMESSDAIEKVNKRMFDRLMSKLTYLAVLFYSKDDCKQCDRVLEELEKIDDEADQAGIKFVKIEDVSLAKSLGVHAIPALVFFKKSTVPEKHGESESIIYAGDLKKGNKILDWLIAMRDPGQDKIEDVDESTLRRLLTLHEHVTVYFCEYSVSKSHFSNFLVSQTRRTVLNASQHWKNWRTLTQRLTSMALSSSRLPTLKWLKSRESRDSRRWYTLRRELLRFTTENSVRKRMSFNGLFFKKRKTRSSL